MTDDVTSTARKLLRARAHSLRPVVMIGNAGLTATVLNEIDRNLVSHELVKVRVFEADHEKRSALLEEICAKLTASAVQHLGKILVIYRAQSEGEQATAKKTSARRTAPRRTKRSYQR